MKNIKCSIIEDLLPLYIDQVTSPDSNELVENHLASCADCQKEYKMLSESYHIPKETNTDAFQEINNKLKKKKRKTIISTMIISFLLMLSALLLIFGYQIPIQYDDISISVEQKDLELWSTYSGPDFVSVKVSRPVDVEIEGKKEKILLVYYAKTIGYSFIYDHLENTNFNLSKNEDVDAVYYGDFNKKDLSEEAIKTAINNGQLIWKKK